MTKKITGKDLEQAFGRLNHEKMEELEAQEKEKGAPLPEGFDERMKKRLEKSLEEDNKE